MINEIMALYCIVDDLLKAIGHAEDSRRQISDAEVITTGLVAARFFGGNHRQSRDYLDEQGLIPQMLSPSRLNRRLHAVAELIYTLQQQFGQLWMHLNDKVEYLLDSFPVAVCDNIPALLNRDACRVSTIEAILPPKSAISMASASTSSVPTTAFPSNGCFCQGQPMMCGDCKPSR